MFFRLSWLHLQYKFPLKDLQYSFYHCCSLKQFFHPPNRLLLILVFRFWWKYKVHPLPENRPVAGKKFIQRLLFNRIDAKSRGPTVGGQHHLVINVLAYKASAALAFMQLAVTWAEVALNTRWLTVVSGEGMPPPCRVGRFRSFYASFHFWTP